MVRSLRAVSFSTRVSFIVTKLRRYIISNPPNNIDIKHIENDDTVLHRRRKSISKRYTSPLFMLTRVRDKSRKLKGTQGIEHIVRPKSFYFSFIFSNQKATHRNPYVTVAVDGSYGSHRFHPSYLRCFRGCE